MSMTMSDVVDKIHNEIPKGYDITIDIEKGLKILIVHPDGSSTLFQKGGDMIEGTLKALEKIKEIDGASS